MAFTTILRHDDAPRYSGLRAAAELANAIAAHRLNGALTAAGSAIGTSTTQVKTVNATTYTVGGKLLSKGATDPLWTLAGTVVAVNSFQKYLLLLDASGTATVQEGLQSAVSAAAVAWTNISKASDYAPILTVLNAGKAIISVLTIATDGSHTFTPGTTALNAAGITATFVDGIDPSLLPLVGNETGLIVGNF